MLNIIWSSLILLAVASGFFSLLAGDVDTLSQLAQALTDMARLSVEISIGLIGLMAFWLGLFAVAQQAGMIEQLARVMSPLFTRLMPEVPPNHIALGSVSSNLAANMLGLDNAATPLGIKAMTDLERLNPNPGTITQAQSLFLVLNTSSVTLIPITVLMYRAVNGSQEPGVVYLPIMLATAVSTLAGLLAFGMAYRCIRCDRVLISWLAGFIALVAGILLFCMGATTDEIGRLSTIAGNGVVLGFVALVVAVAWWKRVDAFAVFAEGAKEGFEVAIKIIPYLVGLLCAIGLFRASGLMDQLVGAVEYLVLSMGFNADWVKALPTGLMKPFSGSGARAMLLELIQSEGVDSFPARVAAIMQGSSETTFYVIAVYGGAVGLKRFRYTVPCALVADGVSIIASIGFAYVFFGSAG